MKNSRFSSQLSSDSIDEDKEFQEKFEEEFDSNGDVVRVANLTFISGVLGKGAFGTVRLAKRKLPRPEREEKNPSSFFPPLPISSLPRLNPLRSPSKCVESKKSAENQQDSITKIRPERSRMDLQFSRSKSEPSGSAFFINQHPDLQSGANPKTPKVVGRLGLLVRNHSGESAKASFYIDKYASEDEDEQLVAVKIFRKSILKKMRTMERNKETRKVQVKTALMRVEREIAIMKKLCHPNLTMLYDVLDSPESDMLYMVLEYMPLGEILTYQDDGTFRRKEPKDGKEKIPGVVDGHFDEERSALFFVDILHGLAYLHDNRVIHRDLKPENILLDHRGIAKLSDFGVSHMFGNEEEPREDIPKPKPLFEHSSSGLTREDAEKALAMSRKSNVGLITKTEGTYCFWSPEMCEGGRAFSGYAQDMWAAGICLYILVTGMLPFFSEIPLDLMEMIAEGEVPFGDLTVSEPLLDLLKLTLEKDPEKRAGVGDCLRHPFLEEARSTRIYQLSDEFRDSHKNIEVCEDDLRAAFQIVTKIPSVLMKSASKHVELAGKHLARLTRGYSSNTFPDQSPTSTRSVGKPALRENTSSLMSDTSDTTISSPTPSCPTTLPIINSESDGYMDGEEDTDNEHASSSVKGGKHHHHRNNIFSNIFRRGKGGESSPHGIQTQQTY